MGNESHDFLPDQEGPQQGPSWDRPNWPPLDGTDDLTAALDPTAMQLAVKTAAAKAGKVMDDAAVERAAGDSIRAMLLIRTYRVLSLIHI